MPITENVGGVLRTHTAEYVNVGGVLKEQNTMTVNDGGVLREVYSTNKVKIEGITPLVVADDHIVITQSGSGTISLPAGTRIILGSGAHNVSGGCVAEYTLTAPIINATFTATVDISHTGYGNYMIGYRANKTKLIIGSSTYSCGATVQIIQSKWGPIGGQGGAGEDNGDSECEAQNGTGAGGAGGKHNGLPACAGGNNGGYGNFGGNGSTFYNKSVLYATNGSSGKAGAKAGSGGGGGYAAGGGESAGTSYNDDETGTSASFYPVGENGEPGAGIIVIEW